MSSTKLSYKLSEAAEIASVSLQTLRRAIDRGELARKYPTSTPVVLHTDLQLWLESLPENPPPPQRIHPK